MAELRELDAGSWFSPNLREALLTLGQVWNGLIMISYSMWRQRWPLDLSSQRKSGRPSRRVCALGDDYFLLQPLRLLHFKQIRSQARTGILNWGWSIPLFMLRVLVSALHPNHLTIIPELVAEAQQNGMMVNVWTVDASADIERAKWLYSIITNNPERVQSLL